MHAVISGRAGVAILVEGGEVLSVGLDRSLPPVLCTPRAVRFLLGDARDLEVVEDGDLDALRQRLADARAGDDALQLTLFLLDAKLSDGGRETAARALEGLFARDVVLRFVEGVLYSHPLPASADLAGALRTAERASSALVEKMWRALAATQAAIEDVWRAWEALPDWLFEGEDDRARVRAAFVRAGLFWMVAGVLRAPDSLGSIAAVLSTMPGVQGIKGYRTIIQTWLAPLRALGAPGGDVAYRPAPEGPRFPARVGDDDPWEFIKAFDGARGDLVTLLQRLFFTELRPAEAPGVVLRMLGAAPESQRRAVLELLVDVGVRIEPPVEGVRERSELALYPPDDICTVRIEPQPLDLPEALAEMVVDVGEARPTQGFELQFLEDWPTRRTRMDAADV